MYICITSVLRNYGSNSNFFHFFNFCMRSMQFEKEKIIYFAKHTYIFAKFYHQRQEDCNIFLKNFKSKELLNFKLK